MDRYGMCGKVLAKEGQRDALLEILMEASQTPMKGCEIYRPPLESRGKDRSAIEGPDCIDHACRPAFLLSCRHSRPSRDKR